MKRTSDVFLSESILREILSYDYIYSSFEMIDIDKFT